MHQRCQDQTDTIAYRAVRRDRAPQTSDAAADASRAVDHLRRRGCPAPGGVLRGGGVLLTALRGMGGQDRPTVEDWDLGRLILPAAVKAELQELVSIIKDPDAARAYGVEPPSGLLLTGPPGTGKTTIAKVIAAQSGCSFYPIAGADVTSKWIGESERNIAQLFERARENQPSIIFMDEIDAIASRRGDWGSYDQQINQLLQEIDGMSGQRGVFVMGATNRPDKLDPALLRGGRLSRTINIPPPDGRGRVEFLEAFTRRMPLSGVDLAELADRTAGLSGADIKALCQQAALAAIVRQTGSDGNRSAPPSVTREDFHHALEAQLEKTRAPIQETG